MKPRNVSEIVLFKKKKELSFRSLDGTVLTMQYAIFPFYPSGSVKKYILSTDMLPRIKVILTSDI